MEILHSIALPGTAMQALLREDLQRKVNKNTAIALNV